VFDSVKKLQVVEQAEKLLSEPGLNDLHVFLHDYNFRPGENRFRRDHAESLVDNLTGNWLLHQQSFTTGAFDRDALKNRESYVSNSRFERVPFQNVRTRMDFHLHAMHSELGADAREERKELAEYEKFIGEKYRPYLQSALRLESEKDSLRVVAVKPLRFSTLGMGNFLNDPLPGEISVSPDALRLLERQPPRSGQQGFEIFSQHSLMWFDTSPLFIVDAKHISVNRGAMRWFRAAVTVQK
jgi:hypothetical protein